MQKLQRVDTGAIERAPSAPPLASSPASSLPAPLGEIEDLENQIAKAKKVTDLRRQLAEAQALLEDPLPPSRPTWF